MRPGVARYSLKFMQISRLLTSCSATIAAACLLINLAACGGGQGSAASTKGPPVAVIAVSAERGEAPFTVEFSGGKSYDDDGNIAAYQWTFPDTDTATGAVVRRTFDQPGDYSVTLQVTDNDGLTAEKSITVTALAANSRFRIGGVITAMPYTDVDGDVNDPFADYFDNDGHTSANYQSISNPVLLNGYATASQTGQVADTFSFEADIHDIYSVELKQGDFVSMRVVDFAYGDLDLSLIDRSTYDVVGVSDGRGEYESVSVPRDGRYLVMINAASGRSRYLLKIGKTSLVSGPAAAGQSVDFEPDQAIFKRNSNFVRTQSMVEQAQLRSTHRGDKRAALAFLNSQNPQTQTVLQLNNDSGFEKQLAQKNPAAAAKLRTLKAIKRLRQEPDIEYAEPNYRVRSMLTPSDPAYVYQWHYGAINLPQAWNITTGSSDVIVAVIDTGVFLNHPDLRGQLVQGYDFISSLNTSNDGDGIDPDPSDPGDEVQVGNSSWHGTHVAGTIAAALNNREGGVGVAPGVRVMPLRAMGRGGGLSYDVLQAVRYAVGLENDSGTLPAQPADIINLSLGGGGYSQVAQDLYRTVRNRGIFVIAAAGNENSTEPMYPASYNGVVSVAASDFRGERAPYSNRGPFVDVTAPGGNMSVDRNNDGYADGILSTGVSATASGLEKSYVFYQGTSMASPHIAGIVALMKSVHPGLTPDDFDSLLASGEITDDKGEKGRDDSYGHGLIDAYRAVEAARALAAGGTTAALIANTSILVFEGDVAEQLVSVETIGNGRISVIGTQASEPWLQIAPRQVNGNGVGTYAVTVDRNGLQDGLYSGSVEFTTDVGTVVKVQVNMRVGEFVPVGNAGYLYMLLIDANLGAVVMVGQGAAVEGQYTYHFDDVPLGDYYIAAGSDVNNDGYVCELGESCGFYPSLGEEAVIRVDNNRDDLNFPAGISPVITTSSTEGGPIGFSRVLYQY
jgi:serine protease